MKRIPSKLSCFGFACNQLMQHEERKTSVSGYVEDLEGRTHRGSGVGEGKVDIFWTHYKIQKKNFCLVFAIRSKHHKTNKPYGNFLRSENCMFYHILSGTGGNKSKVRGEES